MTKPAKVSRRDARVAAMHVVFTALTMEASAADSIEGVGALLPEARWQRALADPLAADIIRVFDFRRADIEGWMAAGFERPLAHMTMVERAVIAAGAAELLGHPDTPVAIIIDEGIELAKQFGAEGGGALVHGVLNAVAGAAR